MKAKSKAAQVVSLLNKDTPVKEIARKTGATPSYVNFIRRRMSTADVPGFKTITVKKEGAKIEIGKAAPSLKDPSILDDAKAIIYGDREKTYGEPSKNLTKIAELWTAYSGVKFNANDVCMMMILLKVARLTNDSTHRDSLTDLCGYAALMERIQK